MTNALRLRRERYSAGSSRERVGDFDQLFVSADPPQVNLIAHAAGV